MEKTLFMLGLIRKTDMYGYHLIELAESHFNLIVSITKPTAYRLLDKMTADGWISYREEQVGNRPPRQIYSITAAGEAAFCALLRKSLGEYHPTEYASPVNLAFLSALPVEEVLSLLEARRSQCQALLWKLNESETHQHEFALVFKHQRRHFEAELSLTEEVIAQLQMQPSS
jgi:DNA-binding PadR family transcriptional regulator